MLFVFRHGESLTNIDMDKTCAYPLTDDNIVLTAKGVQHALDVAKELKTTGILPEKIITSPLSRARQTSYILASTLQHGCPIIEKPEFHEIRWHKEDGSFNRLEEYGVDIDEVYDDINLRPLPDLESQQDVYNRVTPHLPEIIEEAMDKPIYVVCHYFVIRAIRAYIEHGSPNAMLNYNPPNVDPTVYTPDVLEKALRYEKAS